MLMSGTRVCRCFLESNSVGKVDALRPNVSEEQFGDG